MTLKAKLNKFVLIPGWFWKYFPGAENIFIKKLNVRIKLLFNFTEKEPLNQALILIDRLSTKASCHEFHFVLLFNLCHIKCQWRIPSGTSLRWTRCEQPIRSRPLFIESLYKLLPSISQYKTFMHETGRKSHYLKDEERENPWLKSKREGKREKNW